MLFPRAVAVVAPPAELSVGAFALGAFAGPAVAAGSAFAGAGEDDAAAREVGALPSTHIFR